MKIIKIACLALALALGHGRAMAQCDGCTLKAVVHTGFWMGSPSNLPGVIVAFTPTGGSSDGGCIGEGPCQSSPCTYKKGVVTVFNENNPEPVDVSNINGAPRAIVEPGESVPFPVLSDPPSGQFISCGANVGLLVMNTESDGDFYISLRCTSCPEDVNGY